MFERSGKQIDRPFYDMLDSLNINSRYGLADRPTTLHFARTTDSVLPHRDEKNVCVYQADKSTL